MSRGKDTDEDGNPVWERWTRPFSNAHAPSRWKVFERRQERNKAKQALRNNKTEVDRYHRPYYW